MSVSEAEQQWEAVDGYATEQLLPADPVLEAVRTASTAAGLPDIAVSPLQARLLQLLVQMHGARRVLEIGTLGGYSTVWMARALPVGGHLVTLEVDPHHAEVASRNLADAGVGDRVTVKVGVALQLLPGLADGEPFDFVFIDADKPNNTAYLDWALRLTVPGSVIVVDNVVRHGEVADAASTDDRVQGARAVIEAAGAHSRLAATVVQTVGAKGYDGFLLARVVS